MKKSYLRTSAHFDDLSKDTERIRELLVNLFDGKDSDGKKMGIYIERKKDRWIYTIKGKLPEIVGRYYCLNGVTFSRSILTINLWSLPH